MTISDAQVEALARTFYEAVYEGAVDDLPAAHWPALKAKYAERIRTALAGVESETEEAPELPWQVGDEETLAALNAHDPDAAAPNLYDWSTASQERMRSAITAAFAAHLSKAEGELVSADRFTIAQGHYVGFGGEIGSLTVRRSRPSFEEEPKHLLVSLVEISEDEAVRRLQR